MNFEWDESKNKTNIEKHGIDFETAALVFGDENRLVFYDEDHSLDEDRYITIGSIKGTIIIVMVVYTENDDVARIISARQANNRERKVYVNGQEKNRY